MRRYAILVLAALVWPGCLWPQTTGLPPFGSLDRVGLEMRNNQDLNVLLAIPVMSSPGRSGLDLNFSVVYNSSIWTKAGSAWVPNSSYAPIWGWSTAYSVGSSSFKTTTSQSVCDRNLGDVMYIYYTTESNFAYTDPAGTVHTFPNLYWRDAYNECTGLETQTGTFTAYAGDGTGYYMTIDKPSGTISALIAKNGFHIGSSSLTDLNGNYISSSVHPNETDWTDSRGQLALKTVVNGTSSIQYEFLDPNGGYQTTTVNLETLNVKTNFGCSGVIEFTGSASVPQSIVLPNGQEYQFTYEPTPNNSGYYTGRLQKVILPTGGSYEYDYTGSNDGASCTDGSTLSMNRIVSDENGDATWNYIRNNSSMTTITTPKLADTAGPNDMDVFFNSSGQETQRNICSNSPCYGTPLRTIVTTWASNGTPATQRTILDDGTTQSEVDTTYDSNGLLDSVSEYGFGSGGHGGLIRTTTYSYVTSTNYTNLNILDLVQTKQIKDGNGAIQYRQDTTYDGSGDNQGSCPTGVPQHNDGAYGCGFFYRGNPTVVTSYLYPSGPSGPIAKVFTYDEFGNLLTAQVNCCQTKTWTYSAATEYSEPDSVQSGSSPSLTTYATYYPPTGQLEKFTDENGLATNYSYDTLRRPTQISQTNGENVSYSYNDPTFTTTTTTAIDGSKSIQQVTNLNGLGQPFSTETEDGQGNGYSLVSSEYDLAGRAYKTTGPLSNSATTGFDALGRPTSVTLADNSATTYSYAVNTTTVTDPTGKQRKSVLDAAGRLSSVYEPDPSNGNSLTLQTSYTYNVFDELTQVSQGSQTRSYIYDALGRLTSFATPETIGASTNFSYDSFDNVLTRTDARGVVTNYSYL